jgi:hypothetical protein
MYASAQSTRFAQGRATVGNAGDSLQPERRLAGSVMFDSAQTTPRALHIVIDAQWEDGAKSWGQQFGAAGVRPPVGAPQSLPLWSDRVLRSTPLPAKFDTSFHQILRQAS